MTTISLCMIVKNEEDVLARCLDSVKEAMDEIIILDTGSVDRTKEIALRYTNKVYDFTWIDDFSAARNASYERASMDYQMWLDADDVLPPESMQKLLQLKETLDPGTDMVTMPYVTYYGVATNPTLTLARERLTRREKMLRWIDPIHECIPLSGQILRTDIEIRHQKESERDKRNVNRNLHIFEAMEASGRLTTPRKLYYFARELKDHAQWAKAVCYFELFLDGGKGWIEDNIAACYNLAICYKEMGQHDKAFSVLMKSFIYDAPRAEILSEMGYCYKNKNDYPTALKWFLLATKLETPQTMGFILLDYWGYIPHIESCVCYCELGDYEKASLHNELAAGYHPGSTAVQHNRAFLETQRQKQTED